MSDDLTGLNLVELIDLLEPVPEPAPISLWPQTIGWLWLALFLLLVIGIIGWRWFQSWRANAYRRAAVASLASAQGDPAIIATILRRTALSAFPRGQVAGLYGDEWLAFLDRTGGTKEFSEGAGRALLVAPYGRQMAKTDLTDLARSWVETHQPAQP
ncbi:MAG: DUF4381 domain-containing protein [Pseudomonadota bacterium]